MRGAGLLLALCALCALLSLLVYIPAFDNPFRQDDFQFLTRAETGSFIDALKPSPGFAFYRPGAAALFDLEHSCFGQHSGAYIAFNYALHIGNSILMLFVLMRLGLTRAATLIASGLYLVGFGHYGKQVMWACSSGPLASVFFALAALLVIPPADAGARRAGRVALAAFLMLVSAAFHEWTVTIPVVAALLVYARSRDSSARRSALVFLALIPIMMGLWFLAAKWYPTYGIAAGAEQPGSDRWVPAHSLARAVTDAPSYLLRYLGLMVFPVQPTALAVASHPMVSVVTRAAHYLHLLLGAAILAGVVYVLLRRKGAVRVLAAWLLLALLPFTLVEQPNHRLELRYLFAAAIPLCALAAIAVVHAYARAKRAGKVVVASLVLAAIVGSVILQIILERSYDRWPSPAATAPRESSYHEAPH